MDQDDGGRAARTRGVAHRRRAARAEALPRAREARDHHVRRDPRLR